MSRIERSSTPLALGTSLDLGPRPVLGYAAGGLDRAALRRADPATLAALAGEPSARAYLVGLESIALKLGAERHDPLFAAGEMPTGADAETVFLGMQDGAPRFAVALDAAAVEALKTRAGVELVDLRSIALRGLVDGDHLAALATGKCLLNWHRHHRFCANCGGARRTVESGWRRDCPSCGTQHFPRTDPVVIMLATDGDFGLLGRSYRFQPGMWSCLAGFVEPGETIEDAVRRETHEEAGIVCGPVTYMTSQPWPFPMSMMIGCHAQACSREIVVDHGELEDARWFGREEIALMLARRHPGGLTTPPPFAIAHHLLRAWVEKDLAD